MTSILFVIVQICRNLFKWNYINNKSFFLFFAAFTKFILSFKDVEKKDDPHSLCISKMADCEICD